MSEGQLWSINALATELDRDHRTVKRALEHVKPDGMLGKFPAWLMATAVKAMTPVEQRFPRSSSDAEAMVDQLEAIGDELSGNLKKLAAIRRVAERRKFVEDGAFRKLGQFADGLLAAARDDADRMIMKVFVDREIAGVIIGEILRLCEWGLEPEAARDRRGPARCA
jgi:DNA-binding transcriptional regulator YhcF (GntR family)